jgi:hypothetical protein
MSAAKNSLLKLASWTARALPVSIKRWFYKVPFLAAFLRQIGRAHV